MHNVVRTTTEYIQAGDFAMRQLTAARSLPELQPAHPLPPPQNATAPEHPSPGNPSLTSNRGTERAFEHPCPARHQL